MYPLLIDLDSRRGGTIKVTIWLARLERATWITAAEVLGLGLLLFSAPGRALGLAVGLPLLLHLGYSAMTSLPMGAIPRRPDGVKQVRRNQDLRSRVVGFLNQVRHVEEYAQRAKIDGQPRGAVEENVRSAQKRMMAAAAEVAKVAGRADARTLSNGGGDGA